MREDIPPLPHTSSPRAA